MNSNCCRSAVVLLAAFIATSVGTRTVSAQAAKAKPKTKSKGKAIRSVTFANLTKSEVDDKVREMLKAERQKDKLYVKSIDVKVSETGVRYNVTFQTYLPRTRYAVAASRAALDEAVDAARQHGGILITDLKAYKYNGRVYFAYVSRIVAQRDSKLNFRVIADLSDSIFKQTIDIQAGFNRRLVQSTQYTDRNDRTLHAMLFVDRSIKLNRPNFRFREGK